MPLLPVYLYFFDLGLRNHVLDNFNPLDRRPDAGALVENAVLLALLRAFPDGQVNYWHTIAKAEVDFLVRYGETLVPVEVKYRRAAKPKVSRSLRSFIKSYNPERAPVATRDLWARTEVSGTELLFAPACYL